ncbi:MAG: GldG family protein [Pseudomonadota bacterium]
MPKTKLRSGSNAIIYSVFVIGILVVINLVASRYFTRLDLTEEKIYTISECSKKMVADLPDRMTAKAFISSNLPPHPPIPSIARYLKDMLQEYSTYSKGKFHWELLDPAKDDEIKKEARRLKVPPRNLKILEKSQASLTEAFLGVAFQYEGKVESIPFVGAIDDLENQISSLIRRVTTKKQKVGFTGGHGEPSTGRGLVLASRSLETYDVETVDLTEGKKPIPDDIDILVTIGPTNQFAPRAKYEIDQFLMKGKPWALFLDGTIFEVPRGQFDNRTPPQISRVNVVGLADQLQHYGVKVGEDLIMDPIQNARARLPAGPGQMVITNYPGFPIITDLSKESPITRSIKSFVPVFVSSLELNEDIQKGKAGVKATILGRTSAASWSHKGFFLFDAMHRPKPSNEKGPFVVAAALVGSFKSFFAGKQVPEPGPTKPPTEIETTPSEDGQKSPPNTRIVIVGDADMVKDEYAQGSVENQIFLQNTVDFLARDECLIGIRTKGQTNRPFTNLEESSKNWATYGNVVGLPLAFILFGLIRWRIRRAGRKRHAAEIIDQAKFSRSTQAEKDK